MRRLSAIRHVILFITAFLLLVASGSWAQNREQDSILNLLRYHQDDTTRVKLLYGLAFRNAGVDADSALMFSRQALELAEKLRYENGIFWSRLTVSASLAVLGNYPLALDYGLKILEHAKASGNVKELAFAYGNLSECYYFTEDYGTSLRYERACLAIAEIHFKDDIFFMWIQLSRIFHAQQQNDSALFYARRAFKVVEGIDHPYPMCSAAPVTGNAFMASGMYDSARYYYLRGIPLAVQLNAETDLIDDYNGMAGVHRSSGNVDSALWYSRKALSRKPRSSYPSGALKAVNMMVAIYDARGQNDSTLKYLRMATTIKDTLFSREKTIAVQNLNFKEAEKQREIDDIRARIRGQIILYTSLSFLVAMAVATFFVVKDRRQKQLHQIRNSIAEDLHDDIGSTLSSIGIMSELGKRMSPETAGILTTIGESTALMQDNMDDIVWAIKAGNDRFGNVELRMRQFASEILVPLSITFTFDEDPGLSEKRLTMQQRKNLFLIYKEALNNSAKYSQATVVEISLSLQHRRLVLSIADNGVGFDTRAATAGNGIASMRKRAAELQGNLVITSGRHGTRVSLEFRIS